MPVARSGSSALMVAACSAALMLGGEALAADTIEPFEPGQFSLELYLGYGGLGLPIESRIASGDLYVGYGVAERLSAFFGLLALVSGSGEVRPDLYAGVFGTPVDTKHFDFDLLLSFDAVGPRLRELLVTPGFEANLDFDSRLGAWGTYLRVVAVIGDLRADPAVLVSFHPGLRWAPREGHELLLEHESVLLPPGPGSGARMSPVSFAFGYNVSLCDWLELLGQVSWAMPRDDERGSVGLMVGFISNPSALFDAS